MSKLKYRFEVR